MSKLTNRETILSNILLNKWDVTLQEDELLSDKIVDGAFYILKRMNETTGKEIMDTFQEKLIEVIGNMTSNWNDKFKDIDRNVDWNYDVDFRGENVQHHDDAGGSDDGDNCNEVSIESGMFHKLPTEFQAVIVYITRVYGMETFKTNIFNWLVDGKCR